MRGFFIDTHQSTVADDIRQQDGGQPASQMDIAHPDDLIVIFKFNKG
jgi:hypothetical protein